MPNVKLHVDQKLPAATAKKIVAVLPPLRAFLCDRFAVPAAACQLAVITVGGLPDQPQVNVELAILPGPERTRDRVTAICAEMQALIAAAAGCHVAVRCSQLDAATYVALK